MTEQPLVSVIINCYNGEKYLREAIDSVLAQTYKNWEIVFWDNQSTDSTREIVESYGDPRIHYFYAPEHTTLGKARNLAVGKANGEYINFLDADDVWMPEKLADQVNLIEPGVCEVVYTGFDVLFDGFQESNESMFHYYQKVKKRKQMKGLSVFQSLLYGNFIIFSSVLFNKSLFIEIGGVNDSFQQNEDYELLLRCSLKTELKSNGKESIKYRVHGDNNSSRNGICHILENRIIYSTLPNCKDVRNAIKRNENRYAIYLLRKGEYLKGISHFLRRGDFYQFIVMCKRHI